MKRIYATYIPSRKEWITMKEYQWYDEKRNWTIPVPKHYVTDLGTVPKLFWWFVNPFEIGVTSTVVHDMAYDLKYPRNEADKLFWEMMKMEGVPLRKRILTYIAVRSFGWTIYYGYTTKLKRLIGIEK